MAKKKVKSIVTNTKGQKVTSYSDGTKSYSTPTTSKTTTSTPAKTTTSTPSKNTTTLTREQQIAAVEKQLQEAQDNLTASIKAGTIKSSKKTTKDNSTFEKYDNSILTKSAEFKALSKDDQEAVMAVFDAVAGNDQTKAKRLVETFKAMSKTNDVYFGQQLRLAQDAIERGYVEIGKEADFKELQAKNRLSDLRQQYALKKNSLSLDEATAMKDIEREYTSNLEDLQTGLAESGFTSSSRRVQKEKILNEATQGLRESKQRTFGYERSTLESALSQGERDTAAELARLAEVTKSGQLDFLRKAEQQVGTENLPTLIGAEKPLGGIYGDIPEKKLQDTLSAMQGLVF